MGNIVLVCGQRYNCYRIGVNIASHTAAGGRKAVQQNTGETFAASFLFKSYFLWGNRRIPELSQEKWENSVPKFRKRPLLEPETKSVSQFFCLLTSEEE